MQYANKSFSQIKEQLQSYIKRTYPSTYQDFNKSSFGSMMLDLVSYLGDQLHFYIEYAANEANPATANEPGNLNALLDEVETEQSAYTEAQYMVLLPANASGTGIDPNYDNCVIPTGIIAKSTGGNEYENVRAVPISSADSNTEILGHILSADGSKIDWWMAKTTATMRSGIIKEYTCTVGPAVKNRTIMIPDTSIIEVIKAVSSEGDTWHKVKHLSEKIKFESIPDPNNSDSVKIKPKPIPRRFVEKKGRDGNTYITFGNGSEMEGSDVSKFDPSPSILKKAGYKHDSSTHLDLYEIAASDSLGIAPNNTTLTITYRANTSLNPNAAVGTITQLVNPEIKFKNEHLLDQEKIEYIKQNMQVINNQPVNGKITIPNTQEIRKRYLGKYSIQNRAVTLQDYIYAIYQMPSTFGSVKRAAAIKDKNDLRRNINIYLIGESASGHLEKCSTAVKQNVKTHLDEMRMISDSIDLFDAYIINLGLEINIVIKPDVSPQSFQAALKRKIHQEFVQVPADIGECFYISKVLGILQNMPEVIRVPPKNGVKVKNLVGGNYSTYSHDILGNQHVDDSYIFIPKNCIWEIKYIDDIIVNVGIK